MILPLVPLNLISSAHSIILTRVPNDSQALDDYCTYLLENWIGDASENINEKFARELWNHHESEVRTNNHLEGFHSKLNKLVRSAKPHIYKMINVSKRQEQLSGIKYLRTTKNPKAQSTKKQLKNAKIEILNKKFELDKDYKLEDYMIALS